MSEFFVIKSISLLHTLFTQFMLVEDWIPITRRSSCNVTPPSDHEDTQNSYCVKCHRYWNVAFLSRDSVVWCADYYISLISFHQSYYFVFDQHSRNFSILSPPPPPHPHNPDELHALDMQASDGGTAVYIASQEGHLECLKLLLKHGASANIPTKSLSALPLYTALKFSREG